MPPESNKGIGVARVGYICLECRIEQHTKEEEEEHQRLTKRPPPKPSDILKRFHALYDDKLCYYKNMVSK